mmetsp:Transcript_8800/g.26457  ORF Transcript_8800/g.26457 Transcript_8800/m.26457 type:complete len:197 (+) Transcript_8800:1093-1683(+)
MAQQWGESLTEIQAEFASDLVSPVLHAAVRFLMCASLLVCLGVIIAADQLLLEYYSYHQFLLIVFTLVALTVSHHLWPYLSKWTSPTVVSVLMHVSSAQAILCDIVFWTDPNSKTTSVNMIVHGLNVIVLAVELTLNKLRPRVMYFMFSLITIILYLFLSALPLHAYNGRWIYSQMDPDRSSKAAIVIFYISAPLG